MVVREPSDSVTIVFYNLKLAGVFFPSIFIDL